MITAMTVLPGLFFSKKVGYFMSYQEYFGETHHLVRQTVRKFVEREILPQVDEWEEQGEFPRELYRRAGEAGILGIGYPEAFGGTEGDLFLKVAAIEEIARCGSGGWRPDWAHWISGCRRYSVPAGKT